MRIEILKLEKSGIIYFLPFFAYTWDYKKSIWLGFLFWVIIIRLEK
jgi:hypothetical protein